jgi:hypothetical protein
MVVVPSATAPTASMTLVLVRIIHLVWRRSQQPALKQTNVPKVRQRQAKMSVNCVQTAF